MKYIYFCVVIIASILIYYVFFQPVNTALIKAAGKGDSQMVSKILKVDKSSLNIEGYDGWIPITIATANGHLDVVKTLLRYGSSVFDCGTDNVSAIFFAWNSQNKELQKIFLNEVSKVPLNQNKTERLNEAIARIKKSGGDKSFFYKALNDFTRLSH